MQSFVALVLLLLCIIFGPNEELRSASLTHVHESSGAQSHYAVDLRRQASSLCTTRDWLPPALVDLEHPEVVSTADRPRRDAFPLTIPLNSIE